MSPRARKWGIVLLAAVVLYTIGGFFVLPAVLKSQLESKLPPILNRQVSIERIDFNPFELSLRVTGFRATEPSGDEFASFSEFFANLQLSSLFQRSLNFKEVSLKQPFSAVALRAGGKTNFDNIGAKDGTDGQAEQAQPNEPAGPAGPTQPMRIRIDKLALEGGRVQFEDASRSRPYKTMIGPIHFIVTNFKTDPDWNHPHQFSARMDPNTVLSWSGKFSVAPLWSEGEIELTGVQIKHFEPYYADAFRGRIADGEAGLRLDYRLDTAGGPLALQITNGSFDLTKLVVHPSDSNDTVFSLPKLTVTDIAADLSKKTASVGNLALADGVLLVQRLKDGSLNLDGLTAPKQTGPRPATAQAQSSTASSSEQASPWRFQLRHARLSNFAVTAEDKVPATPSSQRIDQLNLDIQDVTWPENRPLKAETSLRWNGTGTLAVAGTLTHSPVSADLTSTITAFDLRALQPYISEQTFVQLTSGLLNSQAHVTYGNPTQQSAQIRVAGALSVSNVAASDSRSAEQFVKWDAFGLNGVQVSTEPTSVHIEQVHLKNFKGQAIVAPSGQMNLATLVREQPTAPGPAPVNHAPPVEQKPAEPLKLTIDAAVLENAAMTFADRTVSPEVKTGLYHLTGRIRNIALPESTKMLVDLSAKADNRAPFRITGDMKPNGKDSLLDLVVALKGYDVPAFSPYSGKFVGYPISKGKLSLDLKYKVAQRKLSGENTVLVDQLTLGQKTDSPDATSLPVKLALAVLTDRKGQINLDVPVTGDLNDPEFSFGRVILRTLVNLLEKVALAPFSLLGAVAGGGGDDLKEVVFQAGSATLAPTETEKLAKIAKALEERPALNLEIAAAADPSEDRFILARTKLRHVYAQKKQAELQASGKPLPEGQFIQLEDAEYQALVRGTYAALQAAAQNPNVKGEVTLENLPPPPKKSSGFLDFLASLNPFKRRDAATAAPSTPTAQGEPPRPGEPSFEEIERTVLEKQRVDPEDYAKLIASRAEVVQNYLIEEGQLSPERVFVAAPKSETESAPSTKA